MRRFAPLAALFAAVPLSRPTPAPAPAAPCVSAVSACERWVTLGGGSGRSMFYATHPLDQPNPGITRALVMIHGAGRNADHYFETATAAAFLAGALENTIVLAPRLIAAPDVPKENEILWRNTWRSGGVSASHPTVTSFDFIDELLRELANKKVFPNLTRIVVAGHSAGGQVVTRYEMTNKVHDKLGVAVSYVVANPSSYAWPTALRPLPQGDATPADAYKESLGADGEKVHSNFTFGPFDSTAVKGFNAWPMGLTQLSGYTAGMSVERLKQQLAERPTTYLLGQVDVLPLGGFDSSPGAMAQGPTRRARGEAFFKYVTDSLGAKHQAMIVSECGHNDRCMFTTSAVLPVLFPK